MAKKDRTKGKGKEKSAKKPPTDLPFVIKGKDSPNEGIGVQVKLTDSGTTQVVMQLFGPDARRRVKKFNDRIDHETERLVAAATSVGEDLVDLVENAVDGGEDLVRRVTRVAERFGTKVAKAVDDFVGESEADTSASNDKEDEPAADSGETNWGDQNLKVEPQPGTDGESPDPIA